MTCTSQLQHTHLQHIYKVAEVFLQAGGTRDSRPHSCNGAYGLGTPCVAGGVVDFLTFQKVPEASQTRGTQQATHRPIHASAHRKPHRADREGTRLPTATVTCRAYL